MGLTMLFMTLHFSMPKNRLSESYIAIKLDVNGKKIVSSSSTELSESDDENDSLDWLLMP